MGPFDRFNDRAKRVLALAQDEAIRFNHNYIGTEHLLLGLIREGEGVAARVLEHLGVDMTPVRRAVEASIGRGTSEKAPSEITLAPQVKKIIGLAIDEARSFGHSHIGTEHLLLGIVREGDESPAAKVLKSLGVDLEKVRHDTIAEIGQTSGGVASAFTPPARSQGPFDRFNAPAKRVLALAQDEAIRFNHNYIGTEHLLLGLAREGAGVAARTLDALGVTLSKLRTSVEAIMGRGDSTTSPSEITLSPRTKKVIELAIDEARRLGHGDVGTEHLLLGLVREGGHIGSKALESLGVTLESVRDKVIETLGQPQPDSAPGGAPPQPNSPSRAWAPPQKMIEFTSKGGPFDRFNERAKQILAFAQDEAIRLKHNYIGTEHLLLGLARDSDTIAGRVLESLGVEISKVRTAVEFIIGAGGGGPVSPDEITLSPRSKMVIDLAIDEADRLGQAQVGPEHLLLGLVREGQGIASGVIESLGVTMDKVRQQVLATLGRAEANVGAGQRPQSAWQHSSRFVFVGHNVPSTGPFDLLDDAAKRVLAIAEEEARQMRHNWIGTEHMLIALLRAPGLALRVLHELGVTLDQARAGVFKAVPPTETDVTEITVTPRVKTLLGKAITLAAPVSDRVRPQHLLLALVADPDGIGSQLLSQLGVTKEKVREAVDRLSAG
jgi:ATP-dependent Clp protease ATP-binding subunit ClpA